ncbi:Biotin--protein ligase [Colletotrichum sidae]|uniref:Biotin--protein ligase n=1 Tax=Colletotrichum sidae TaxID=1347389 RepID=A0A4R8TDT5_9PEZI|nr:Biotin--protein ligase [Colletotrichum sidae]
MASRKLNVLVYTGSGTTVESVRHCIYSLRRLLSPTYAVIPVAEAALLKEPWQSTCALLVIPGGGDLGFCRVLNGPGNRRIAEFVRRGGAYLGFCAGGYYGSRKCEFEVGDRTLEVIGTRELAFFPGTCRGGAFKGFAYHSERGARAVKLTVSEGFSEGEVVSYYNGGGVFVDASNTPGVEVLATYSDDIDVDGGDGKAAVVYIKVGSGNVILTGPHPEFAAANLHPQPKIPSYESLTSELAAADAARVSFLRACLAKLGLDLSADPAAPPSLSRMHLTSANHTEVGETLHSWEEAITRTEDGDEYIHGEHDVFRIEKHSSRWDVDELRDALPRDTGIPDYDGAVKVVVPHEDAWPDAKETPSFNHRLYYDSLQRYRAIEPAAEEWGTTLMYGEVVTSTNTLMDKNIKLLSHLPTGFTLTATTQVAGRGRGTNVWVSPAGCLIFSTVINHPAHLAATHPVVFLQYISAIAIVEAVQSYDKACGDIPIKLKWPNDIYCRDPNSSPSNPSYVKIGGILSTCSYSQGSYQCVVGIGINTTNTRPTTSLNAIAPASLVGGFHLETLLARLLTRIEALYKQFRREGFSRDLEERYYKHWLHSGQHVTLEAEAGARAKIVGITRDWGLLKAVEVDRDGREMGRMWALQSDENSFDFWKGLVKRKLLNNSRASNTLWLLEELNLTYTVQTFRRQPTRIAPPELAQVHPLGKAPVLEITPADGGEAIKLAESGYITQYLLEFFGRNKPSLIPARWKEGKEGQVGSETAAYARFQYLLHYVEGSFFPNLVQYLLLSVLKSDNMPFPIRPLTSFVANKILSLAVRPDAEKHLRLLDEFLRTAPGTTDGDGFLCGPELSGADILISFGLVTADSEGAYDAMGKWERGSAKAAYPRVFAYLERLRSQPGYVKATEKAKEIEGR